MPVLICKKCNKYYELEKESDAIGFGNCDCGNNLLYFDSLNDYYNPYNKSDKVKKPLDIIELGITIFIFIIAVGTSSVCLFYINLTSQVGMTSIIFTGIPFIALMGFVWLMFLKSAYSLFKK